MSTKHMAIGSGMDALYCIHTMGYCTRSINNPHKHNAGRKKPGSKKHDDDIAVKDTNRLNERVLSDVRIAVALGEEMVCGGAQEGLFKGWVYGCVRFVRIYQTLHL